MIKMLKVLKIIKMIKNANAKNNKKAKNTKKWSTIIQNNQKILKNDNPEGPRRNLRARGLFVF